MTEEEIRADERARVAVRLTLAAARYQQLGAGPLFIRGVRMAATLAERDTPVGPHLALVKTP